MQLLEADLYPYLFKTLFGILMLLPQSTAFETLKNRLGTVTSLGVMQVMPKSTQKPIVHSNIDFDALLQHFSALQSRHAETLRNSTPSPSQTSDLTFAFSFSLPLSSFAPPEPKSNHFIVYRALGSREDPFWLCQQEDVAKGLKKPPKPNFSSRALGCPLPIPHSMYKITIMMPLIEIDSYFSYQAAFAASLGDPFSFNLQRMYRVSGSV